MFAVMVMMTTCRYIHTYEVLALLFPQTACDCVSLISITGDLINLKAVAVIFQLGT